jgi:hypothetical protein
MNNKPNSLKFYHLLYDFSTKIKANLLIILVSYHYRKDAFLLINLALSDLILLANAPFKIVLEKNIGIWGEVGTKATRPFLCKDRICDN